MWDKDSHKIFHWLLFFSHTGRQKQCRLADGYARAVHYSQHNKRDSLKRKRPVTNPRLVRDALMDSYSYPLARLVNLFTYTTNAVVRRMNLIAQRDCPVHFFIKLRKTFRPSQSSPAATDDCTARWGLESIDVPAIFST